MPFRLPARRAGGAAAGRPPRPLPDLQRGLRGRAAASRCTEPSSPREAIRLARLVHGLLPDDPEVDRAPGAHAPDRRAAARAGGRRRRSRPARGAGPDALGPRARRGGHRARRARRRGRAPSASTSSRPRSPPSTTGAPTAEETDWPQILALYGLLEQMTAKPGRDAQPGGRRGDGRGAGGGARGAGHARRTARSHHRVDAVRAHLLELAGDTDAALDALPRRRPPDDEPPRAALPRTPGGPARVRRGPVARTAFRRHAAGRRHLRRLRLRDAWWSRGISRGRGSGRSRPAPES